MSSRRPGSRRAGLLVTIPAITAIALVALPLVAMLAATDWRHLGAHLTNPVVVPAIRLSLITTIATVAQTSWRTEKASQPASPLARSMR